MAHDNVLKNYDFALEIDGIFQVYLQGVTPPTVEYTEHKQGSPGNKPDKKTPGKKIVGDLVVEQVVNAVTGDPLIWQKFQAARTGLRNVYIGTGFLVELGPGGVPVNRFFIGDCWIKKIESSGYDTRGDNSADVLRTVTYSVEDYVAV
jgi:hypothetical protein